MQPLFSDKIYVQLSNDEFQTKLNENVISDSAIRTKIIKAFRSQISVEELQQFEKDNPSCSMENEPDAALTALCLASCRLNLPLIQYIVGRNENAVNLRATFSANALFSVFYNVDLQIQSPEKTFPVAQFLIQKNSSVNSMSCVSNHTPGTTALSLIAERIENLPLIQLLILQGGVVYTPFSQPAKKNIEQAVQLLFDKVKILLMARGHSAGLWQVFPKEILHRIVLESCQIRAEDCKPAASKKAPLPTA